MKIVKGLRTARGLSQAMLTRRQQFLLKYQRKDMIITDASSSDSDADIAKLDSKNPFLRLLAMSRLRHEVGQYDLQ